MTYFVIGLMSGSSLDGLDICYTHLSFVSGKKWECAIRETACIPYPDDLKEKLSCASTLSVPEFLLLDIAFARFCADEVNHFIKEHDLEHQVFFIAAHGHTVWHDPANHVTTQIGDGATIAALTGYNVISDLRNMDVALGGQGAPIVPIADKLLFPDYDFCLNLGGIANVTVNGEELIAFDICPANQLLNHLAQKEGMAFDEGGALAREGKDNQALLAEMDAHEFYRQSAPKSLSNAFSAEEIIPLLEQEKETSNALHTAVSHIARQIAQALASYITENRPYQMLVTGGGAFNTYLIQQIEAALAELSLPITCDVPHDVLITHKEALAMALVGALRWREEENTFASVTGAERNAVGGALWLGK